MFKNITLEVSLKPFKQTDSEYIQSVVHKIYEQWRPLIKNRDTISILLWSADGSEILDYTGNFDEEFNWCCFIGSANRPEACEDDPLDTSLHDKHRVYVDNPPKMTYRILKEIVNTFKNTGKKLYPQTRIRVGATFDIGPEFAISTFKYIRHPEICTGSGMGEHTFINSYGLLNKDDYPYAAFPKGIEEGTPFGKLLGGQSREFMQDLDFDYIWLSNGVGFTANSWSAKGEIFDGKSFNYSLVDETKNKVFDFWKNFRDECPDYPVETRGTNFSAGLDYASDAVCLYDIYKSNLNITPPPNSPWAAIDGRFDLELMGHMTRICELPDNVFMFRYYLHDPWWMNTPWYDRYNGKPHDIYLPMAISRIDKSGKVQTAELLNLLTVDNTLGNMPDNCVNEPLPHLLKAEKDAADEPAPFTWIYPFREFTTAKSLHLFRKMVSEDWFICNVISNGFPISSVVSTDNFICHNKDIYQKTVLISSVPEADSDFETAIIEYIENNGKVVFYGSVDNASEKFLKMFDIKICDGISGEIPISIKDYPDIHRDGIYPEKTFIDELSSNGTLNTITNSKTYSSNKYSLTSKYKNATWFRAIAGSKHKSHNNNGFMVPYDGKTYIKGEILFRQIFESYGYSIKYTKSNGNSLSNILMLHKHNNAQILSVMSPDTTTEISLKFPLGAPVFDGYEAEIKNNTATYRFPKSEHIECRVFVEQESGTVGVREIAPVSYKFRRRIGVTGLENATVRFFSENYCKDCTEAVQYSDTDYWFPKEGFKIIKVESAEFGTYYEARNVTGTLVFGMPFRERMN